MPNITDYIVDDKLTLAGIAQLIADYDLGSASSGRIFVINHPADFKVLSHLIPKHEIYAVILQNTYSSHKTPVIVYNHQYLVLDSLGDAPDFKVIKDAILAAYPQGIAKQVPDILYSSLQRQSDEKSCGTDALVVSREALHMGRKLFALFNEKGSAYCPAQIAKYTQAVVRLHPIYKKGQKTPLTTQFPDVETEIIQNLDTGAPNTLLREVKKHATENGKFNTLLDQARNSQHKQLEMDLEEYKEEELRERARKSTGIDMISKASLEVLGKILTLTGRDLDSQILPLISITISIDRFTLHRFNLLGDDIFLAKKHEKIRCTLKRLEDQYLSGDQNFRLETLALHYAALRYIEQYQRKLEFKAEAGSEARKDTPSPQSMLSIRLPNHALFPDDHLREPPHIQATPPQDKAKKPQGLKFFTPQLENNGSFSATAPISYTVPSETGAESKSSCSRVLFGPSKLNA